MEQRKVSLEKCSCSFFTSGYGSSLHYIICARCAGQESVVDGACNDPFHPGRSLYRSSMTRKERLSLEREEGIAGVQIYLNLLTDETFSDGTPEETTKLFRDLLKREVEKVRAISKEIGPVRPVTRNIRNHD